MASQKVTDGDSFEGVRIGGEEHFVRARSQHSRSKHVPKTDDDGAVVRDDAGHPKPACDVEPNTDTTWVLRPASSVENRDECTRCASDDKISDDAKANGGNVTWARKMRYGDDWGSNDGESSSDTARKSAGD